MINRDHDLTITRQAQFLGISRAAVYYLPRSVSDADLALMRRIDELHLEHPFMGARMLHEQLARWGLKAGRSQPTRARPQDLPLPAAQAGNYASQPGLGAGHDRQHLDGAGLRLPHRGGGRGQPQSHWRPAMPGRSSSRSLRDLARPRSSTPVRTASSRPRSSPASC